MNGYKPGQKKTVIIEVWNGLPIVRYKPDDVIVKIKIFDREYQAPHKNLPHPDA